MIEAELAHSAQAEGWQKAFFDFARDEVRQGRLLQEDQRSADWTYLLPLTRHTDAMVIGCGLGTIPVALSTRCKRVHVVDSSDGRLDFLAARKEQEGIENLHLSRIGGLSEMPFENGSLDFVGFAGFERDEQDPVGFGSLAQNVSDLLTEGGSAYFAVTNRMGFDRFLGGGGTTGTAPLTLRGYKQALRRAGFTDVRAFAPLPASGAAPLFYLPLDDARAMKFFFRTIFPLLDFISPESTSSYSRAFGVAKWGARFGSRMGLTRFAKFFVPGFGLVATKADVA